MRRKSRLPIIRRAEVLQQLLRWRLTWNRHDLAYLPDGLDSGRFLAARDAAELVPDAATVVSCGLAANARCSIFYWAIADRFRRRGRPKELTWISVGAQGGRSRVPGTIEELALPGLITRYISGHVETARALLALAQAGQLELHLLPQGEMTRIIEAQATGETSLVSPTGLYTFLDPRDGRGSPVAGGENLIRRREKGLEYRLPKIDVALLNAPWADREGNIYFRHAATLTESLEAARAARANGGRALVAVADIIEASPADAVLRAEEVDAIVVNPDNEQTGGVPQRRYWPMFTPEYARDRVEGLRMLRFANDVLGYTPARRAPEQAVARLGAWLFTRVVRPGATVNLGVGYGEEVVRVLAEQGLHEDVTFTTETGAYGGVPAPGIYFGAAVGPQRLESSAWMFRHYLEHLDAAILGFLEVDSEGNVNAAERGPRATDLVGPGGLPSIAAAAGTIVFVGGWMAGARWRVAGGRMRLRRRGKAKFVERVRSVTFSARAALEAGKDVWYVTHAGLFRLRSDGLSLVSVLPGIDVDRHVIQGAGAAIHVPERVPVLPASIVSGRDYTLQWGEPMEKLE